MSNLKPNKKGLFEGWTSADWAYAIISYLVFAVVAGLLKIYVGLSKDWTLALILIPIGIFAFLQNRIKNR